jgi:exodeoxyribonuclease V alpha subunit
LKHKDLYRLYDNGILSALDIHFANFMSRLTGGNIPELSLAAALVSSYTRQGHVCLDLSSVEGKGLLKGENGIDPVVCPDLNNWCKQLRKTGVVGNPGEYKPLILDDHSRLYLFRYWEYQEKLANSIRSRINDTGVDIGIGLLKEELMRLFPLDEAEEINWQRVAAFTALTKRFCVISGGPHGKGCCKVTGGNQKHENEALISGQHQGGNP